MRTNAEHSPASIVRLILTHSCNLRCIYCHNEGFFRENPITNRADFSIELLEKALRILQTKGVHSICLTGGEPLLSKQFFIVAKLCANIFGGEFIHLTTNGIHLHKYLKFLKDINLHRINVSCDTVDKDRFYKITGSRLFDRVVKNVEEAVGLGFFVNINCLALNKINMDKDYVCSMVNFWSTKKVRLSFLRLCFAEGELKENLYNMNDLINNLESINLNKYIVINENRPPTHCYKYGDMEIALRYYIPNKSNFPCNQCLFRQRCSEGFYHPRLALNGIMRACILRDDLKINLFEELEEGTNQKVDKFLNMFNLVAGSWQPVTHDE